MNSLWDRRMQQMFVDRRPVGTRPLVPADDLAARSGKAAEIVRDARLGRDTLQLGGREVLAPFQIKRMEQKFEDVAPRSFGSGRSG
ncbi:MAG: hypothetical protein VKO21_07210 [Candidatus Sericytochromatia bacterium]|nr:hypothetical protein [Candidatus Sericytochromatia bacterium]